MKKVKVMLQEKALKHLIPLFIILSTLTFLFSCNEEGISTRNTVVIVEGFSPVEGPVGTEVKITGAKFSTVTSENEVLFNGSKAAITSATETEIKVKVPEDATTGKITVTVNGHVGQSAIPFQIKVNPWIQKKSFSGNGRQNALGFSIENKGYVGLGESGGNYYKDFWEYDPDANTWSQKADFPGAARESAVGFSIDGKGYVGTGKGDGSQVAFNDFYAYDPVKNTWIRKADLPGQQRYGAVGFSIGAKGYIGCGDPPDEAIWGSKDFWAYHPSTDSWVRKADFPGEARSNAVGFSIDNTGYIGLGVQNKLKKDFWAYNPSTDEWSPRADFGGGVRSGAVAFVIDNAAYVGTGTESEYSEGLTKDLWKYNPAADHWVQIVDFFGGETVLTEDGIRTGASAFAVGPKGFVGLGDGNKHSLNDLWEYTPE